MTEVQQPRIAAHEMMPEPRVLPPLRSNSGAYVDPSTTGWMRPTSRDTPIEEMRRLYETEGYVWVKQLLPREDVYDMREQ